MKILIPILMFFLTFHITGVKGQVKHDLSTDLHNPIFARTYGSIFYEISLNENLGLENGIQLLRNTNTIWNDSITNFISVESFKETNINLVTSLKWYFTNKKNEGFYIGPFHRIEVPLWQEEGYEEAFMEKFGRAPEDETLYWGVGVNFGFKYLLYDRFIIEGMLTGDIDIPTFTEVRNFTFFQYFKIGYRFGK